MRRAAAVLSALALALRAGAAAPPAPAGPDLARRADAAHETIRDVCGEVLSSIRDELLRRHPGLRIRLSGGRSKMNDYRAYRWLSVKFDDREYLLAAHHENLDRRTGNPHTQLGRLQFWRCFGPNGPHEPDGAGGWRLRFDNEWAELPRIRVWDDGFSAARAADLFETFLEERGEGAGLAAASAGRDETRPPAADVPPARRREADEAIETIRAAQAAAAADIVAELRSRRPDWKVRVSSGNSRVNDYRCYRWITVKTPAETFWISLVFNDQDPATGNTHSQFGRLQFWRDIRHWNGPKNEAGPHELHDGAWVFRFDKQWEALPRLHLWSPDYAPARVVDLFETFVGAGPAAGDPAEPGAAP